jgi:hypothetical protein
MSKTMRKMPKIGVDITRCFNGRKNLKHHEVVIKSINSSPADRKESAVDGHGMIGRNFSSFRIAGWTRKGVFVVEAETGREGHLRQEEKLSETKKGISQTHQIKIHGEQQVKLNVAEVDVLNSQEFRHLIVEWQST